MIDLVGLEKSYGDRTLFAEVDLRLQAGARYGLVGANGSGKTTLLAILAGREPATEGEVVIPSRARIGLLEQDRFLSDAQRIIDVAMMGDREVWDCLQEQERLLSAPDSSAEAITEIEERIRTADGYSLRSRAAAVLEGLGIPALQHERALSTLSGGFKLRVLLAQTLVGKPDLLLLDEPTNHLDILTIRWLEKFLAGFPGCAVVISHDHRFLDNVATHILDVDYETVTLYTGNHRRFLEEKQATRERMESEATRQQELIDEKKAFVERFRAKATKARQAQSRAKQIEKLEQAIVDVPQTSRRAPHFRFDQKRNSGQDILSVAGLRKSFGAKRVLSDVSLAVRRGERVAVIGANGLGKSTLLKIAVDRLAADSGSVTWGYEAQIGYFAQDHRELFDDPMMTVLEFLWDSCRSEPTTYVRGQLGRMLFSGDDVDKRIHSLSGGEAARLIFARLIVQQPNVLLLDEPTNHLDLESIESLVEGLEAFRGTLVFVSHDRWFVSKLATRIVELRADGIEDFPGTYDEYLAHCNDDHLDADAVLAKARRQKTEDRTDRPAGDWQDHKKRRSEHQKLLARRDRVTAALDGAEKRLAEIRERYCQPGFFEATPPAEVSALQAEEARLGPEIEALMGEWESVEEQLATLGEMA
jgi:ATPase subunit of ABC transporter with duplicated ATPase domains